MRIPYSMRFAKSPPVMKKWQREGPSSDGGESGQESQPSPGRPYNCDDVEETMITTMVMEGR